MDTYVEHGIAHTIIMSNNCEKLNNTLTTSLLIQTQRVRNCAQLYYVWKTKSFNACFAVESQGNGATLTHSMLVRACANKFGVKCEFHGFRQKNLIFQKVDSIQRFMKQRFPLVKSMNLKYVQKTSFETMCIIWRKLLLLNLHYWFYLSKFVVS